VSASIKLVETVNNILTNFLNAETSSIQAIQSIVKAFISFELEIMDPRFPVNQPTRQVNITEVNSLRFPEEK
jgi:hypothetical protein